MLLDQKKEKEFSEGYKMIKRILKNTIGVALGGVGIKASKDIDVPGSEAIGIGIAGGLAMEVSKSNKKTKGGIF